MGNKCKCPFAEIDLAAEKEADEMEAVYRASIGEERWVSELEVTAEMIAAIGEPNDPLAKCEVFCKHMNQGKGHPGEYVYYCCVPDTEQIIHVDFNESEII